MLEGEGGERGRFSDAPEVMEVEVPVKLVGRETDVPAGAKARVR